MAASPIPAAAPRHVTTPNPLARFWRRTIGKKIVMAVTGLVMIGFLVTHVAANLLVFGGPEGINAYAAKLRDLGPLLWVARAGLLAALVLHVTAAWQLTQRSRSARAVDYDARDPQVSTFAARTIRIGGVVLLVFVIFHLMHFTFGVRALLPTFTPGDVHGNLVAAFQSPLMVALYVAVMLALGLHLYHGLWGSLRTLGLSRPSAHPRRRRITGLVALLIYGGFTLIPIGILLGFAR